MECINRFCIIGGDLRQVELANALAEKGYGVWAFGFQDVEFHPSVKKAESLSEAMDKAHVIILPLPCSVDGQTVNTFFYHEKVLLSDVFERMSKQQILLGGKVDEKLQKLLEIYNIYYIDYFEREEMTVLNAIPTAEGAIQIAMEELPTTLHSSDCLVLGFGRVGKALSNMLRGIGANVSVAARKYEDLAWIGAYGARPLPIKDLKEHIGDYDVVFNTVPAVLLDEDMLKCLKRECLVIDLASKPGGVDFDTASTLGIKAIWALSLPGKVAPRTAGNIIMTTLLNILEELGVLEWY